MPPTDAFELSDVHGDYRYFDGELDVAELMRAIRNEVIGQVDATLEERLGEAVRDGHAGNMSLDERIGSISLARLPDSLEIIPPRESYTLRDFLNSHDEEFLGNAYRTLLLREPDADGASGFLQRLRSGKLSRIEVLGRLRYSGEGRAAAVPVHGLLVPFGMQLVRRIPIIGPVLEAGRYLLRAPADDRHHERFEGIVRRFQIERNRSINALTAEVEATFERFRRALVASRELERTRAIEKALQTKADRTELTYLANHLVERVAQCVGRSAFDEHLRRTDELRTDLVALLGQVEAGKADRRDLGAVKDELARQIQSATTTQEQVLDQRRRLEQIHDEFKSSLAAAGSTALAFGWQDDGFTTFYAALENRFRGSREDIGARAKIYLPVVRGAGAGATSAPVLDLGCGRGEWLELLRGSGLLASGVDLSGVAVRECQTLGLDVTRDDAVGYLRALPPNSLGAVTGIHVIEHLGFAELLAMLDQTLRVLRPGGVAIFETPNPENIVVGACNFYIDPTHVRPLPPELMQFVLETRGFASVKILRLGNLSAGLPDETGEGDECHKLNPFLNALRHNFFSPPDYAVIGVKS